MYKTLREPSQRNPHAVTITSTEVKQSSIQIHDFVFCSRCEEIFNKRGERFIHSQMATTAGFPLLHFFRNQTPEFEEPGYKLFAGVKVPGLDAEALLHYGAGIFSKAAAHEWEFDRKSYSIDLGKHTEALRNFVKDGAWLPRDIVVGLSIASTPPKFVGFFPPVEMDDSECIKYQFYASGILYTLMLGDTISPHSRTLAFSVQPRMLFVRDDVSDQGLSIMRQFTPKSGLSTGVRKLVDKQRRSRPPAS